MSAHDSRSDEDRADEHEVHSDETDRYDELEIANGDVVIYDAENHRAWIQSDDAVPRESMA